MHTRGALNRLSILHVLAPGEAGGLESVVRLLAAGQRDQGHDVRVAAVVSDGTHDHPFVSSLKDAGIEATSLAIPNRAYLREWRFVGDLCRRYCPTVVHTHGFRPDVLDAAVARRRGVPTVTTVHGRTGGGWKVGVYERIQGLAFRYFDAVVAVSRPLADDLATSGVRPDRIHVVPNAYVSGVQVQDRAAARRRLSIADDRFVVGWVGRLSREKGLDVLVDSLPHLSSFPLTVSVFGDGPERQATETRSAASGLGDRIRWHGLVRDAASFFPAFDVFVLSSRTEGCPMVLFEAMAAGVPIVAASVGGVPDILSPREALLVRPNDPLALGEAISSVYRDRESAATRAVAARDRLVTEFDSAPWLARYDSIYRRIRQHPAGAQS